VNITDFLRSPSWFSSVDAPPRYGITLNFGGVSHSLNWRGTGVKDHLRGFLGEDRLAQFLAMAETQQIDPPARTAEACTVTLTIDGEAHRVIFEDIKAAKSFLGGEVWGRVVVNTSWGACESQNSNSNRSAGIPYDAAWFLEFLLGRKDPSAPQGQCGVRLEFPDKDLYAVLGVGREAKQPEIKAAYRGLVMKWHPDKNGNSQESTERFQEIGEAHGILSDPEKRVRYDREQPTAGRGPKVDKSFPTSFSGIWGKALRL
jgi:molecular chaperone DnaJ